MKREELKALGIAEELISEVMSLYGKSVSSITSQLATVTEQESNLKEQLKSRDSDLKKLQKDNVDNEDLKAQIDKLQTEYKLLEKNSEQKLIALEKGVALNLVLADAKVKNPVAVKALLDQKKITFEGKELKGVTEQIEALKESDPYMFDLGTKPGSYKPKQGGTTIASTDLEKAMQSKDFNFTEFLENKIKGDI